MRLAGIAACVPRHEVETAAARDRFAPFEVDRIIANTGVLTKREAAPGVTATDLCIAAAEPLVEALGWARETIDAVIMVTTSPDYITPASAHCVQQALGLSTECLAFDVNLACSGFTHGLIVIDGLITAGIVRRALLLCGEMTSNTFRPRVTEAEHRADLANAILFGDAGSAAALCAEGPPQLRARAFGADGAGHRLMIVPGGGNRQYWGPALLERRVDEHGEARRPIDLVLRGPEILTFTIKRVPPLLERLLTDARWSRDDVDAFVLHQANRFMLEFLARRMKLPPDKIPLTIAEFGNTASASIPLTMVARTRDRMQPRTRWVLMGFGVGLSWSGVALETEDVLCLPLIEI